MKEGSDTVPRFYFDVEDGGMTTDEEGVVLASSDEVAPNALRLLVDIARFEVISKNERRLSVTVRDEGGRPIYRSKLTVEAEWISEEPGA